MISSDHVKGRERFFAKLGGHKGSGTGSWFRSPVLGPLLQNRSLIATLTAVAALQVGLTAAGLPAWQCPLRSTLGVPGPGCGLTRAIVLLLQGQWHASIASHAFAPLIAGIGILLAVGNLLPTGLRRKVAHRISTVERHTGIFALLMMSMLAYWILRLIQII